jgi:hypothetical protein
MEPTPARPMTDKPKPPTPAAPSPAMQEVNRLLVQIDREERRRARRNLAALALALTLLVALVTWLNVRQTDEENRVLQHYGAQQLRMERDLDARRQRAGLPALQPLAAAPAANTEPTATQERGQ